MVFNRRTGSGRRTASRRVTASSCRRSSSRRPTRRVDPNNKEGEYNETVQFCNYQIPDNMLQNPLVGVHIVLGFIYRYVVSNYCNLFCEMVP